MLALSFQKRPVAIIVIGRFLERKEEEMTDQNTTTPSASQKQNEPSVEQVFTPAVDAFQGSAPQVPNAGAAPQAAPFSSAGGSSCSSCWQCASAIRIRPPDGGNAPSAWVRSWPPEHSGTAPRSSDGRHEVRMGRRGISHGAGRHPARLAYERP